MLAGQPGVLGEFFKFLVEVVKAMVARNMGFMEMLSAQVDYLLRTQTTGSRSTVYHLPCPETIKREARAERVV
eukprot:COSAG02_NODE_3029_length_7507_cov_4.542953_2_plen_73_part_00